VRKNVFRLSGFLKALSRSGPVEEAAWGIRPGGQPQYCAGEVTSVGEDAGTSDFGEEMSSEIASAPSSFAFPGGDGIPRAEKGHGQQGRDAEEALGGVCLGPGAASVRSGDFLLIIRTPISMERTLEA